MRTEDLGVYKALKDLARIQELYIVNFKKEYKYSYGVHMRNLVTEMAKNVTIANAKVDDPRQRLYYIDLAYGCFEAYRFDKQLLQDLRSISVTQSEILDYHVAKIGRQLMGWKTSTAEGFSNRARIAAATATATGIE